MKKSFIHQQEEISFVKNTFTQYLKDKLEVVEVQGPILSKVGDGMQDNLSGVENPVSVKVCRFQMKLMKSFTHLPNGNATPWLVLVSVKVRVCLFHMKALRQTKIRLMRLTQFMWTSGTGRRLSQMVNAISPISRKP